MKKLSTFLFLIFFSFQTVSWADDIRDFELEGISIGDSLLDYFSEEELKNTKKTFYPGSDKFYMTTPRKMYDIYVDVTFHLKKNDDKYIIASLKGYLDFPNQLKACKEKKKEIVSEISSVITSAKEKKYDSRYEKLDDGKSIAYISDFEVDGGKIRIWCENWSKETEIKRNWIDGLAVSAGTHEFGKWRDTESR
tara:strand:- start:33 stop:614 length:582 start_codon:yes stop_codon:yes gene_type:complete